MAAPLFRSGTTLASLMLAAAAGATPPTATLTMNPVSSCVNNHTLVVRVDVNASDSVVGGQFFLSYDTSKLTFVSATPGGGGSPWNLEIFESAPGCPGPGCGTIDYAVGVSGGGAGATSGTMVTLTFSAATDDCAAAGLASFRSYILPTTVTNSLGEAHTMTLNNLGTIALDATSPSITCAPDTTVNADSPGCAAAAARAFLPPQWFAEGSATLFNKPGSGDNLSMKLSAITAYPDVDSYGAIDWTPPAPTTFGALTTLSFDYNAQLGCFGGGAPRFSILLDMNNNGLYDGYPTDGSVFVSVGPPPSFNPCPTIGAWDTTGNLMTSPDARFETSQVGGGGYLTAAAAQTLLGTKGILGIFLVVDAGPMSVLVDNVAINTDVLRFNPLTGDNCASPPTLTGVRSDSLPLTDPYPAGATTSILWTSTDSCGNTNTCTQQVTVNSLNTLYVTVQLASVNPGPFTRCITFDVTSGCPATHHEVTKTMTFTGGYATDVVDVPCGNWTCITARDTRHTLRRTDSDDFVSVPLYGWYFADFTAGDALAGGNLNADNVVDILDFGIFVGQFGSSPGASTTCPPAGSHADIDGDGVVFASDYTFIYNNFFQFNEADCCGGLLLAPRIRVSIGDLAAEGNQALIVADLNHDGWLDQVDMAAFAANGGLPCRVDWNADGSLTPADVGQFVQTWFSGVTGGDDRADFDANARVQPADIAAFVNAWMTALGTGC